MLKKKVLKVLPVWLLALLMVGSAAAAFVWISNFITTVVTVHSIPITLEGGFVGSAYPFQETLQTFNYTLNDPSNNIGYVFIQFLAPGKTLNPSDIEVSVWMQYPAGFVTGGLMPGYPTNTPTDQLTFLFGYYNYDPIDFAWNGATNGTIHVTITYNVAYVMNATIRITSTSS
jgi:hypothetical protein